MLDLLKAVFLGIVEGITEFLPISSTGHLILFNQFIRLEPAEFANAFSIMIQLGAILSVVVLYFHKLCPFSMSKASPHDVLTYSSSHPWGKISLLFSNRDLRIMALWKKVIVGVLPAIVLGLLFSDFIDQHLFAPLPVAIALIFWGAVLLFLERKRRVSRVASVHDITYPMALAIGFFQCLAMVPGTSRSAATIIGAMLLGTSRIAAAEFSFYLAIPTMLGATALSIVKKGLAFSASQWGLILVGALVSFVVALLVIRSFMSYIKKHNFRPFGIYRILLGVVVIIYYSIVGFDSMIL